MGCCRCFHHSFAGTGNVSEEVGVIPSLFLGEEHKDEDPTVSLKKGREVTPCFGLWCTSAW